MGVAQLVQPLEPKAGDHVPGRNGKRSAQASGMSARRAEFDSSVPQFTAPLPGRRLAIIAHFP